MRINRLDFFITAQNVINLDSGLIPLRTGESIYQRSGADGCEPTQVLTWP